MSRSLAAVSCDNYGAVHSFLLSVFSVLAHRRWESGAETTPRKFPRTKANQSRIWANLAFFSSAHLPQESKQFVSFHDPPTPSNVWVGFAPSCLQPPRRCLHCPGGTCHPDRATWTWPWKRPEVLLAAGTRRGWGKRPDPWKAGSRQPSAANYTHLREVGGPWAPTTLCAPVSLPTSQGEEPGGWRLTSGPIPVSTACGQSKVRLISF